MSDGIGMFEHADHAEPRREHGYCTDDMARLLIVAVREPERSQAVRELGRTALRFLAVVAERPRAKTRNRRAANGRWHGRHGVEDCWGRSLWAFGTAAHRAPEEWMRASALSYFNHGVVATFAAPCGRWHSPRSAPPRSQSTTLATCEPRDLLADAVAAIGSPSAMTTDWPWPEPRLSYANAALPEALIAAGHILDRPDVVTTG